MWKAVFEKIEGKLCLEENWVLGVKFIQAKYLVKIESVILHTEVLWTW